MHALLPWLNVLDLFALPALLAWLALLALPALHALPALPALLAVLPMRALLRWLDGVVTKTKNKKKKLERTINKSQT